ncbi:hypothetical protein [Blastopirellula retiformator]|uniref:Uncharacterized protein n=1 Tax=Blastopirellula retiformator TaxID=2527970 RepID=A0A5C5UZV3_9BACT|nr:hypothetical protein [Blastopirellula retiformator]TWT31369.1 hypothetical protein Enr8_32900 [Blastopirellula retiformator]
MNAPRQDMISKIQQVLRWIACLIAPIFLLLVAVIVLIWQFTEITSRQEVLSLTSFLVILTFSASSFNWSRATHNFASEVTRKRIYQAGVDLFLAALLALIASCFAWLQSSPPRFFRLSIISDNQQFLFLLLFWIHWTFLLLALLITCVSLTSLVLSIHRAKDQA